MTDEQRSIWRSLNATKPDVIADYPDIERIDFDLAVREGRDAGAILRCRSS